MISENNNKNLELNEEQLDEIAGGKTVNPANGRVDSNKSFRSKNPVTGRLDSNR